MISRSFQTVRRMREAWKWETYVRSQSFSSESAVKYLHVERRKIQILPWEKKITQMSYPRVNKDNQIPTPCPASPPPHAGMTLIGALEDTNERIKNIDISLLNVVIFLDLKKAFDTMDHVILLQKLEFYGVRSQTLAWFKSLLGEKRKVNSEVSDFCLLTSGIPQGSILGPSCLFYIYMTFPYANCTQGPQCMRMTPL